jgi:diadenosine tetraphosphate (Ap4A) HIT family hydrolase
MPIDATQPYDDTNIFARILRGEVPAARVYEDEHALAFNDIAPQAPNHIWSSLKGPLCVLDDFSERASEAEIAGFIRAVGLVAREHGLVADGLPACSPMSGRNGGQEVPHLHVHILAGRPLGPMLAR